MCLLYVANNVHKDYKFILAANRDEFYDRPSQSASFWVGNPLLLAGKDLKAGGTWLGITKSGRFAALTNYRDMRNIKPDAPSRGALTTNYLLSDISPIDYYNNIRKDAPKFNGFNLVYGNALKNDLYYFSNQSNEFQKLESGMYGLSNCLLDTPWPKVDKIKMRFNEIIKADVFNEDEAFKILSDTEIAADNLLPDTGIGLEYERLLSSVFIRFPGYGTRCSSLILIDRQNKVTFTEKTYLHEKNDFETIKFEFYAEEEE